MFAENIWGAVFVFGPYETFVLASTVFLTMTGNEKHSPAQVDGGSQ